MSDLTMLRFGFPGGGDDTPGVTVDPSGRIATVGDDRAIHQSLLMLLSTRPGERVMRPRYGCPLHRLVFQPLDATTAGLAIHYVERAVSTWEPRVEILAITAEPGHASSAQLDVMLRYKVRATQAVDAIAFEIDLGGGS